MICGGFDVAKISKGHYNMNVLDPNCFWTSVTSRNMPKTEVGASHMNDLNHRQFVIAEQ